MEQIEQQPPNLTGRCHSQWAVREDAEGPQDWFNELSDRTAPLAVIIECCELALRSCF
jgi:hypothetical protein